MNYANQKTIAVDFDGTIVGYVMAKMEEDEAVPRHGE